MPVPYTFANTPNGQTIPLAQLDANFTYIENQISGGSTGLVTTFSGGNTGLTPNTPTSGSITLGGTLGIGNGGTGATSAAVAITNLLPNQSGHASQFLMTDGNGNVSWQSPSTAGVNQITSTITGITATPSSGNVVLGGTLGAASGGTGLTTLPAAGQLLIGTGTGYQLGNLSPGSGISITNNAGSIVISATGGGGGTGTVTAVSSSVSGLSFNTPTTTPQLVGTLSIAGGGTGLTGVGANGTVLTSNGTSAVWQTVSASVATGNYGAITVTGPTTWNLNSGVVAPINLTTGGPSWASNGNLSITGNVGIGTAPTNYGLLVQAPGINSAIVGTSTASAAIVGTSTGAVGVQGIYQTGVQIYGNVGSNVSGVNYSFWGNSNLLAQGVTSNGIGGGTAAYFNGSGMFGFNSSARETKTNIAPVADANWLLDLKPMTFNFRLKDADGKYTDEFDPEVHIGLIAEDVELVKKELVIYIEDPETKEKKITGVHYDRLAAPIIKLLQDIDARLKVLEGK